jgi:hypothetical protein
VPPAGWKALPADSIPSPKVSWRKPSGAKALPQTFNLVSQPFPGTVQMAANSARTLFARGVFGKLTSDKSATVCSMPARTFTLDVPSGGTHLTMLQELLVKDGQLYVLTYGRPAKSAQDATMTKWLQAFCPPASGSLADVQPPSGWSASAASFTTQGIWIGQPGSAVTLMTGKPLPSMSDAAAALVNGMGANGSKGALTIDSTKSGTLCGHPALFVDLNMQLGQMAMRTHEAITQNASKLAAAVYVHTTALTDDPDALAALKTLCADGAMPTPAPSATGTPGATAPSAVPSPSATPTPQ